MKLLCTTRLPILKKLTMCEFKISYSVEQIATAAIHFTAKRKYISIATCGWDSLGVLQIGIYLASDDNISYADIFAKSGGDSQHNKGTRPPLTDESLRYQAGFY